MIPAGRWTNYGALAELAFAGTSDQAIGNYVANTTEETNAYRALFALRRAQRGLPLV